MTIEYFAEYLPRLKTTSIQINIPKEDIKTYKINNDSIILNSKILIKLPKIIDCFKIKETISKIGNNETNIRIQNLNNLEILIKDSSEFFLQDQYQWNIKNFQKDKFDYNEIKCNKCKKKLIELNEIKIFLPMPSELWYEMLDFWHCNKPNINNENDKNIGLLKKFNQLKPNFKNIIIGSYYFLINPEDWVDNILIDDSSSKKLKCLNCNEIIGEFDENIGNFKILKWKLNLDNEEFKSYSFITLKIIEEMNFTGNRIFNLINEINGKIDKKFQIWCFGLGINIKLNKIGFLNNCLKIMYKESNDKIKNDILIEYDKPFKDFLNLIIMINSLLPENLQKFNNWRISYIPIYEYI